MTFRDAIEDYAGMSDTDYAAVSKGAIFFARSIAEDPNTRDQNLNLVINAD